MNTRHSILLIAGKTVFAASLAFGLMTMPAVHAHVYATELCTTSDAYARELGDDDCNGRIDEDESGWDCTTMGNHICGA